MAEPLPAFVARRRPDWEKLRALLALRRKGKLRFEQLFELDALYRRTTSDLATAQTYYAGSEAHRWVNQLCAEAYAAIYRPPRERLRAIRAFFSRDFPRTVRREHRFVLVSLGLLLLGLAVGALVGWFDPDGAGFLIPQGVRDAVAAHRLWTNHILSVTPPGVVAAKIATNNLTVVIAAFVGGALAGAGTVWIMVLNGANLGAVIALCARGHMGWELVGFTAGHGVVELSVIILAGAAGLIIGHAMIDPGELPRRQALARRARDAVRIVLGGAPFLAAIALVEGFVDPGHLFPVAARAAVGIALGLALWGYIVLAGRAEETDTRADTRA